MSTTKVRRIKTIGEFHRLRGLPKPEHPQSFSKLFKAKTSISPLEFRRSFSQ